MSKYFLILAVVFMLVLPAGLVKAQNATPPPEPVYIIQPGDSLSSIASRFGIALNDLMAANNITDPNNISAGAQVIIPGLPGISGTLTTEFVGFGDTLNGLSRSNQIDKVFLRKLNHITSPSELYTGVGLVLPQKDNFNQLTHHIVLEKGESLLEAAVRENSDPWTISRINGLSGTWDAEPGDVLYGTTSDAKESGPSGLPSAYINVKVSPLPMIQGRTEITIQTQPDVKLAGTLVDKPLNFFPKGDGSYVALEGIYAMLDPGPYPLKLEATLPDGSKQNFEQMVIVESGNYPRSVMLNVDPETIDPAITGPEDKQIATITSPVSPEKLWQGNFHLPVDPIFCQKAGFGERRAYNGGDYLYFHAGLDFGVCSPDHPFDIYAGADGVVVFIGNNLDVRGNATIIDHGWGVYTGYWHQKQILVNVGDHVKAGQLIGQIGETGRVTGPHLHWEVWVDGVQVNPSQWLNNSFP